MSKGNNSHNANHFVLRLWLMLVMAAGFLSFLPATYSRPHPSQRILIQPRAGVTEIELEALHRKTGGKGSSKFKQLDGVQLVENHSNKKAEDLAQEYLKSGLVEFAEPDFLLKASALPNDPGIASGKLWALNNSGATSGADIDASTAWEARTSAENVIVAVIDTGVRYTHEDLAANMWRNLKELVNGRDDDGNGVVDDIYGYNAVYHSGDPWDDNGHGTHVAGTIGAVGNNGKGVVGVCWKVQLMACKFMDDTGAGATSDAIACINYARAKGAKVINGSWGGADYSLSLEKAIQSARAAGIIFVAAAGNEQMNNDRYPSYPANYSVDNVLSVTSTTYQDQFDASYANYGARTVDLAAPGTAIYSTWIDSDSSYTYLSGTSMATPHVAGAAALLRAEYPTESYSQIIARLLKGTDPLSTLAGKTVTGGRLNVRKALGISGTTAPGQSFSVSATSISLISGLITLQWHSQAGSTYRVESTAQLESRAWTTARTVTATSSTATLNLPASQSKAFYRVVRVD